MFSWKKKRKEEEFLDLEGGLTPKEVQDERREYVKNIGVEYRYGCFEEKNADSCQLLGEYFEAIEQNFGEALNVFRENCDQRKWPRSCYKYAQYLMAGRMCEPSFKKAITPLEVACDAKIHGACRLLSLIYWNGGHDREPDSAKAEQLMRRACDGDDYYACWTLSTWYLGPTAKFSKRKGRATPLDMKTGSLARDMNKALEYGIKACEEGNVAQSCINISRIYRIGDDVPKDPDKAKMFHDRAIELQKSMKEGWDPGFTG